MYVFTSSYFNLPFPFSVGIILKKTGSELWEVSSCLEPRGGARSPRRGSHVGVVGLFNLQTRLMELHRQWELLLEKMREKGIKLLQAQKLVQYLRECEDVMDWINDKVC